MNDFMIRDLDPEIVAAIDGRAKQLKLSRQQYLHEHLRRTFAPSEGNVTANIAARLREVFRGLPQAPCSIARVAMALGMPDATMLEANLSGEEPLAFATARRLCDLLGVHTDWLLEGRFTPFYEMAQFRATSECLDALAKGELRSKRGAAYTAWYFLLSDEPEGRAAVYGYAAETPCRLDLLLRDVPIRDSIGAAGSRQIFDFGVLCAAIDPSLERPALVETGFDSWGRVLDRRRFQEVVEGQVHPGSVMTEEKGHVPWAEDLWEMEYEGRPYSESFLAGRDTFRLLAKEKGIKTNAELARYIKGVVSTAKSSVTQA